MRFEQLQHVIAINKWKSFNAASEQLHISQQTLSQSVKNLEAELATQLFTRTSKGAFITKKGELFLQFAQEVWEKYQLLNLQLKDSEPLPNPISLKGTLVIYASPIFYLSILPEVIKTFCQRHPAVHIEIDETNISEIYKRLITSKQNPASCQLGLVNIPCSDKGILPDFLPPEGYGFQPIQKGRFRLCISKNSRLAQYNQLSIRTIAKQPIVQYTNREHENTSLVHLFRFYGYDNPKIVLSTNNLQLWIDTIQNDIGVGFLQETAFLPNAPYYEQLSQLLTINSKEYMGSIMGCLVPPEPSDLTYAFLDCLPAVKDNTLLI